MITLLRPFLYILAGVRAILIVIGMTFFMLGYGISCIFKPHSKERALTLRQNYLRYLCIPILNIKVILEGRPQDMPALYVGNHRSFTDPLVLCAHLKAFVIAKAEVAHYPVINKGAELTGVIWVDRNNKDSRSLTRDKMVKTIKKGFNILVYPEGTVGIDRNTLPFKKGTFIEAANNNIPVIPVAIEFKSPRDMWVIHGFIGQYFYQYSKWKTEVKLSFGPVLTSTIGEELHQQSYNWVNAELTNMQKNWSKAFD